MTAFKAACVQLNSGNDMSSNLDAAGAAVRTARASEWRLAAALRVGRGGGGLRDRKVARGAQRKQCPLRARQRPQQRLEVAAALALQEERVRLRLLGDEAVLKPGVVKRWLVARRAPQLSWADFGEAAGPMWSAGGSTATSSAS